MIKRRNYTFALTKDNERIIRIVEKYPKYAYIKHDKDDAEVHYHYYVEFPSPRSLNAVAKELDIPPNMLEQVYSKKGILQYLTHENAHDKHHYDVSEIQTNMDLITEIQPEKQLTWEQEKELINILADYEEGKISYREMCYKIGEFIRTFNLSISFVSLIRLYSSLMRRNGWACQPFRVPCSNTPINGTKKGGKNDVIK